MADETSDKNDDKKPDMVLVGVIAAMVVGLSAANYFVFDALSGRLDVLEANLMAQCGSSGKGSVDVPAAKAAAPKAAEPKPTAEAAPSATASAAP